MTAASIHVSTIFVARNPLGDSPLGLCTNGSQFVMSWTLDGRTDVASVAKALVGPRGASNFIGMTKGGWSALRRD